MECRWKENLAFSLNSNFQLRECNSTYWISVEVISFRMLQEHLRETVSHPRRGATKIFNKYGVILAWRSSLSVLARTAFILILWEAKISRCDLCGRFAFDWSSSHVWPRAAFQPGSTEHCYIMATSRASTLKTVHEAVLFFFFFLKPPCKCISQNVFLHS